VRAEVLICNSFLSQEPTALVETAVIEVRYDTKRVGVFRKSDCVTTKEKRVKKIKNDQGVIVEKKKLKHIFFALKKT
jgi:hypothetical protein